VNCIFFMRAFYAIVVSVLIFTACEQQRVKTPDAAPGHAPLVIDYPAGVLISGKKQTPAPANRNASFAEKILRAMYRLVFKIFLFFH